MTLAEMLDVVEDKAGFERSSRRSTCPPTAISNPTCVGRDRRGASRSPSTSCASCGATPTAVKVTLPGPYLLTRAMFVPGVTRASYPTKEDLGEDVVAILRDEVAELARAGADFIQLDEPVLTELVFTPGPDAHLHVRRAGGAQGPGRGAGVRRLADQRVVDGRRRARASGVHVCRGNWSRDESTLLRGQLPAARAVPRADAACTSSCSSTPPSARATCCASTGKELGLGVVNPRTDHVESPGRDSPGVERALRLYPAERCSSIRTAASARSPAAR